MSARRNLLAALATLGAALMWLPGCGPARPDVATYLATLTNATPEQAAADREFVAKLFAEQAARHGLTPEKKPPSDAVALYFPGPTGLNLSLSALQSDEHSLILAVVPVALGKKDNAACRAVIAAVNQALQQHADGRLVTTP